MPRVSILRFPTGYVSFAELEYFALRTSHHQGFVRRSCQPFLRFVAESQVRRPSDPEMALELGQLLSRRKANEHFGRLAAEAGLARTCHFFLDNCVGYGRLCRRLPGCVADTARVVCRNDHPKLGPFAKHHPQCSLLVFSSFVGLRKNRDRLLEGKVRKPA